eukprot:3218985-Amphidinium_carterae.1
MTTGAAQSSQSLLPVRIALLCSRHYASIPPLSAMKNNVAMKKNVIFHSFNLLLQSFPEEACPSVQTLIHK